MGSGSLFPFVCELHSADDSHLDGDNDNDTRYAQGPALTAATCLRLYVNLYIWVFPATWPFQNFSLNLMCPSGAVYIEPDPPLHLSLSSCLIASRFPVYLFYRVVLEPYRQHPRERYFFIYV